MPLLDLIIVLVYLAGIFVGGHLKSFKYGKSTVNYILGGRHLTLPAFVCTLVATWYGGILGVGEYTFNHGVSNWLIFGVPYYLAAFLFAMLLAAKARRTEFVTIPDRLNQCYGRHAAGVGSIVLYVWTLPTAYILILGVLGKSLFGWPNFIGIIIGTTIVLIYAYLGGFRSLVRTDIWHFSFMFLGFIIMLIVLMLKYGGFSFVSSHIPSPHLTWHGGNSFWFIAVWYVIALSTLVEPAFFQNCYAAQDERTAKRGILISILCWMFFDFLTTSCGLYARALLPPTIEPISSFPELGKFVLPAGLYGLFAVALLATVISTADSYLFIAASTLGKDIFCGWFRRSDEDANRNTRIALLFSAILAVILSAFFTSVVDIWYAFGSVCTPILLVPLFTTFFGKKRMKPSTVIVSMIISGLVSSLWIYSGALNGGDYWLKLEPIFPGLLVSLAFYLLLPGDNSPRNVTG